ncbi:MAG: glycosyltransferase family 4 protein [Candidatus Aceula meridiana]|nr:glycosyltransferase family 4 protein [Candidatus Aceula meridiana]
MDKKKLKIVFYRHSLLSRGGDKMIISYANFLSKQGHDVCLYANIFKTKFFVDEKVSVKRIPLRTKFGTILWALLKDIDADVVIADIIAMSVFLFARNTKRVLYFAQDYDIFYYKSIVLRVLVWFFYVVGLKVFRIPCLAVSEGLKKELSRFNNDISVVQNGIDLKIFSQQGDRIPGEHKKSILIFARKDSRKGLDVSIKALKDFNLPDAEIWVIGEELRGEDFSMLVRNFGYVSPERVAMILRSAAVLLYPSYHEGFGLLVLESMACGCPVVATDTVGFIRHQETGWLSSLGDPGSFKAGIVALFEDYSFREKIVQNGLHLTKQYDIKKSCWDFEKEISQKVGQIKERKNAKEHNLKESYKDYKFYNFPKKLSVEDYYQAEKELLLFLSTIPWIKSVYYYGSYPESFIPGLSDIDFICVIDPAMKHDFYQVYRWLKKHKFFQNFVYDQAPYFVSEDVFRKSPYYLTNSSWSYKYKSGERIIFQDIDKTQKYFVLLVQNISYVIFALSQLNFYLRIRGVNVRRSLNLLKGIRSRIEELRGLDFLNPRCEEFLEELQNIRKNWFLLSTQKQKLEILQMLVTGKCLLEEIVIFLNKHADGFLFTRAKNKREDPILLKTERNILAIFSDKRWEQRGSSFSHKRIFLGNKMPVFFYRLMDFSCWNIVVLPESLANYFFAILSCKNSFSGKIKSSLMSSRNFFLTKLNCPFLNIIQTQAEFYDRYWQFLNATRYGASFCPFVQLFINESIELFSRNNILRKMIRYLSRYNFCSILKKM